MKSDTDKKLNELARREIYEITTMLSEIRKEQRVFNGYRQHNLTQGDSVAFMHGNPNERIKFGFVSGHFPESKEVSDFQGYY